MIAPRRSGVAAGGPPSWKISSTVTRRLRISASGMKNPLFSVGWVRLGEPNIGNGVSGSRVANPTYGTVLEPHRPRLAGQVQGGGADQAAGDQGVGHGRAGLEG